MVRNIMCLAAGAIILAGCVSVHESKRITADKPAAASYVEVPGRLLRHVVLFKFKDGTTDAQIGQIERAFCALPRKIDAIYDFEWGTDVSVENLQQGFTHCFVVSFRSRADRAKYLPHPAHKMFGERLGPHLDKVLVIDYWTK
ncbi:MAG: Dabb family protein [Sedimentisphaerales bacterium]|nr:Dabb family protein [Sedimentisphaerales bacterium]